MQSQGNQQQQIPQHFQYRPDNFQFAVRNPPTPTPNTMILCWNLNEEDFDLSGFNHQKAQERWAESDVRQIIMKLKKDMDGVYKVEDKDKYCKCLVATGAVFAIVVGGICLFMGEPGVALFMAIFLFALFGGLGALTSADFGGDHVKSLESRGELINDKLNFLNRLEFEKRGVILSSDKWGAYIQILIQQGNYGRVVSGNQGDRINNFTVFASSGRNGATTDFSVPSQGQPNGFSLPAQQNHPMCVNGFSLSGQNQAYRPNPSMDYPNQGHEGNKSKVEIQEVFVNRDSHAKGENYAKF